jgi:uncharacterized protein YndB with AHSA1/START domain
VSRLFVQKTIDINAPPSTVWTVLTKPEFTREWSGPFGASGSIDSEWKPGSPVLWRNADGRVHVSGHVIKLEPHRLLQFSVRASDAGRRPPSGSDDDDITQRYELSGDDVHTLLSIAHGDFRTIPNGEEVVPVAAAIWEIVLPKIKELAERQSTGPARGPAQGKCFAI